MLFFPITVVHTNSDSRKEHALKLMKNEYHKKSIFDLYFFDLFETVQEGKGFYDLLKPFMTKKEIYFFIFKSTSFNIEPAVLEGRLLNINADDKIIEWCLSRASQIKDETYLFVERLIKQEVPLNEIQEFYDYFYGIKRNRIEVRINDKYVLIKDFLKRDINTIRQGSNQWHIDQTKIKSGKVTEWSKKFESFEESKGNSIFKFIELNTTRQLINEGRVMHHCVGSYASRCLNGGTRIVSIKKDGSSYLTLELNNTSIVQAKLKANKKPGNFDYNLIGIFADKHNLNISI